MPKDPSSSSKQCGNKMQKSRKWEDIWGGEGGREEKDMRRKKRIEKKNNWPQGVTLDPNLG